jgi:hypothetical protein
MHADQRYLYFPSADEEFCFFAEIVEWDTDSEEVVVERYLTGGGDRSELMSLPLVWPVRRINAAQFMNARRNGWGAMREWYLRFSFNNSSTEYAVVECTAPLSYTGDVLVYAADCREGTWQVIPQEEASRIDIIDLQAFQEALESLGIAKAPPRSSA